MRLDEARDLLQIRLPTWPSSEQRLARCTNIADLRRLARRRVARAAFDYVDGGAEDEATLRRNREALEEIEIVHRVLRDVQTVDASTMILGKPSPLPIVFAPTGFTRLVHHEGELAVARAAAERGLVYTASTVATRSIEQIATVAGRRWFQLYVWRDRVLAKEMIDRARAAGYDALVLTVDVPLSGSRERDVRSGFTIPPVIEWRTILEAGRHPQWWLNVLRSDPITFANVSHRITGRASAMGMISSQFDPGVTWDDVVWMREQWDGPFVIKGVVAVDDAKRAAQVGFDAVVVSNHGGRQLDYGTATATVLPEIADAVGSDLDVFVDGGIRRGTDIVKALALGAKAVLVGRAYLYGLGAGGGRGVHRAVDILETELRRAMGLAGARNIAELAGVELRRAGTTITHR
ncbi:MAG: alpha-hydroxy acid oxidase [Acidimicrobiia bacterium]